MAALPAFQLNMIAKVINAGTGEIVPEAEWVGSFTKLTPVTVHFNDGSYIIWNKDQVIFTQDVLERVKMSFAKFVYIVEKLRNVREQEKALKAELKGFYYKVPETLGEFIRSIVADDFKGVPSTVDLSTLKVGDIVKLREGSYIGVHKITFLRESTIYQFLINGNRAYKQNGSYTSSHSEHGVDIVEIIKKGAKRISNARKGDLVYILSVKEFRHIKSVKKQGEGDVWLVCFNQGGSGYYKDDGTEHTLTDSRNDITLL